MSCRAYFLTLQLNLSQSSGLGETGREIAEAYVNRLPHTNNTPQTIADCQSRLQLFTGPPVEHSVAEFMILIRPQCLQVYEASSAANHYLL